MNINTATFIIVASFALSLSGCITSNQQVLNEAIQQMTTRTTAECSALLKSESFYKWSQCRKKIVYEEIPRSYNAMPVLEEYLLNISEISLRADKEQMTVQEFDVQLERERLRFQRAESEYISNLTSQKQAENEQFWKKLYGTHVETTCQTANGVEKCLKPVEPVMLKSPKRTDCVFFGNTMTCTEN